MEEKYNTIEVVILAAGFGTRLRPLTETIPKVMVPIAPNLPLLEHTLLLLKEQGFRTFLFNLHYLPRVIVDHFGNGEKYGVSIKYSQEEEILETGGAIKNLSSLIEGEHFVLIYGDELFFYDLRPLVDFHMSQSALATLALKRSDKPENGDLGEIDPHTHRIIQWHPRPHPHASFGDSLHLNSGIYVLSKKLLDVIPAGRPVKLDGEILPVLIEKGEEVYGLPTDEEILDIGTPEKYEYAKQRFSEKYRA